MTETAKRSTIYFETDPSPCAQNQGCRHKPAACLSSVNDAVRQALTEDPRRTFGVFDERQDETAISYEELLKDLKAHGEDIGWPSGNQSPKIFERIPKKDVARILKCFDALAEDPRGSGCRSCPARKDIASARVFIALYMKSEMTSFWS